MSSVAKVKAQVENANALGILNLAEKGVKVPSSVSTYEIMENIAEIVKGIKYAEATALSDNIIRLTGKDGAVHTMSCTFGSKGKVERIVYDGVSFSLAYNENRLVRVGSTNIDLGNARIVGPEYVDFSVTFLVEGSPYETISVSGGNIVHKPVNPEKKGYSFSCWVDENDNVVSDFPIVPVKDTVLRARFVEPRIEIACHSSGDVMFAGGSSYTSGGDRTVIKTSDGLAVCGYCTRSLTVTNYYACFVGETPESVQGTNLKKESVPFIYNGKTYYYSCTSTATQGVDTKKCWFIGRYEDGFVDGSSFVCKEEAVRRLLDYYYRVIDE